MAKSPRPYVRSGGVMTHFGWFFLVVNNQINNQIFPSAIVFTALIYHMTTELSLNLADELNKILNFIIQIKFETSSKFPKKNPNILRKINKIRRASGPGFADWSVCQNFRWQGFCSFWPCLDILIYTPSFTFSFIMTTASQD